MSLDHFSVPARSNAFRRPVPVITHTIRPSVTGEGDDICCFIIRRLPAPSGRFHRTVPLARSSAHSARFGPSPTLTKTWSPQTIGVEPDRSGMGAFQVTFSVTDQRSGRPLSVLVPFSCGPRQFGHDSAWTRDLGDVPATMTSASTPQAILEIRNVGMSVIPTAAILAGGFGAWRAPPATPTPDRSPAQPQGAAGP